MNKLKFNPPPLLKAKFKTLSILIALVVIVFISCEKEEITQSSQSNSALIEHVSNGKQKFLSYKLSLKGYQNQFTIKSVLSESNNTISIQDPSPNAIRSSLIGPDMNQLSKMIDLLLVSENEEPFLDNLINNYGNPNWEFSILNKSTEQDTDHIITVPIVMNNNVTSVLRYIQIGEDYFFEFTPRSYVYDLLNSQSFENPNKAILLITYFTTFDFEISEKKDEALYSWLILNSEIREANQSSLRTIICITTYTEYVSAYYSQGTEWITIEFDIVTTECYESSPGGTNWTGTNINNSPNNENDTNINNPNPNSNSAYYPKDITKCIEEFNHFQMKFYENDVIGEINSPCDKYISKQDIITKVIRDYKNSHNGECPPESAMLSAINEALDAVDKIVIEESFKNCKYLNCIYEKLNNSGNGLFCSTVGNFIGSADFDLKIQVADNQISTTSPPDENGLITISLSDYNCENAHPLDAAGALLHEGIHAEMFRKALDELGAPLDPTSYEEIWDVNLKLLFPGYEPPYSVAQHEIMAKKYVDAIAEGLRELDDNQFPLDYYKYIAWDGLRLYADHLGFVDQNKSKYYNNYLALTSTNKQYCN